MKRPSPDKKTIAEQREKIKELEFENELLVETNERVMERNRELREENRILENLWLVFWIIVWVTLCLLWAAFFIKLNS